MNYEIRLRAIEPEDVDMLFEAESDEAAWIYSDYLAPLSKELLRQYALTYDADPFRSGQLRLIIENGKTPVGILDIFDISSRHLRADTGIYILPRFRGKGLASNALEAAKDYSRNRLGLHQLTATVALSNTAAMLCYEKAGFKLTGTRPDWLRTPDGYQSAHILSSLL
ncbi:MAG: GNAT family N-acetyltransferase [Muribaculaceae bacterium]|nr:GNAT family N-acetyltransferase [Muribaculaceae bacterium]